MLDFVVDGGMVVRIETGEGNVIGFCLEFCDSLNEAQNFDGLRMVKKRG
jgi:hypothetical protein